MIKSYTKALLYATTTVLVVSILDIGIFGSNDIFANYISFGFTDSTTAAISKTTMVDSNSKVAMPDTRSSLMQTFANQTKDLCETIAKIKSNNLTLNDCKNISEGNSDYKNGTIASDPNKVLLQKLINIFKGGEPSKPICHKEPCPKPTIAK